MAIEGDLAARCADTLRSLGAPAPAAGAAFALWCLSAPRDRVILGGRLAPRVAAALARLGEGPPPEVIPPGLGVGAAVGMAWAARDEGTVYALLSADELSSTQELTALAVRLGLGNLRIVVYGEDSGNRVGELAARGWRTATAGAHDPRPLLQPAGRRPSILHCLSVRHPAPVAVGAPVPDDVRALARARALVRASVARPSLPAPVLIPEGPPGDVGAFALGVALLGAHIPTCTLPLADAYALTPVLRHAAARRLPLLFFLAEEDEAPADALGSLKLLAGLDVGGVATAPTAGGPRVVVLRSGTGHRRSNLEHPSIAFTTSSI